MISKLFYKSLLTFLVTSVSVVVLMVITMQFFVYRNFSDFVLQQELDSLGALAQALSEDYQLNNNWDKYRHNPRIWHETLIRFFPADSQILSRQPERDLYQTQVNFPAEENINSNRRPGPPPPPVRNFPTERKTLNAENFRTRPLPPPPPRRPLEISDMARRLSLFDMKKRVVSGNPDLAQQALKPITADNQVIGWLGLKKETQKMTPTDISFLKRQSRTFYFIGGIVLFMAVVVSIFFSRHLTAPVRTIAQATNAIRNRQFDLRIAVASNDELGQLAENFNAMAQALQSHESIRRQWLSDIAHELRTPLAVLRAEIEALQDGIRKVTPATINSLHGEVMVLAKIVDDLSLIAKTESGIIQMRQEVINPIRVLENVIQRFSSRFNDNQIAINRAFPDSARFTVLGDADKLAQVFGNIFENILRYATTSESVAINCRELKEHFVISIEDTGPGVPEDCLGRLFDRLYRIDSARTRELGGSGLGLSICKTIIEALQGQIWAENVSAGGLRIIIKLPICKQKL